MRLLLDTHAFLWFTSDDSHLSAQARSLIEDAANEVVLSVASVWEMAIKISLGKLQLSEPFAAFIPEQLRLNQINLLDIKVEHLSALVGLPFHHRDPFDRLLIVQAMVENIPLVSADAVFDAYPCKQLW